MTAIAALLARPALEQGSWRGALRAAGDALHALERPCAHYDGQRLAGPRRAIA